MPAGRPTKYTPKFIDKVDKYLALCGDSIEEYHKTRGDRSDTYERIVNVNLPKLEGFARYIDVNTSTLFAWEKEHTEFSNALDRIRQEQHNMLVDGGISGRYSPVITKLMLSNNHGYREKTDTTTDGKAITLQFDTSFKNGTSQQAT